MPAELPFALTKLQAPRPRPGLVARDALEARLAPALAGMRVTLLSAPAGYGKTAALARQLARLPATTAVAWLAADADDTPARLATCLIAALEPCDPPWRVAPEALAASIGEGEAAQRAAAATLANALAATETKRGLIVIDDLHRITDAAVFPFLEALIERLPARWGIVLSTRIDPPLPLARWRARGDLAELRQDALRFDEDEVRALLGAAGDRAAAVDAPALLQRTQGWPAGLGLAVGGAARAGMAIDRPMFDYLASEVLDDMPGALREFLLRCSVLHELSPGPCAAVSGDADAARRLDELERRALFVTAVGDEPRTLVLDALFRDCLDDRLRRERPHELPLLLRRAAAVESDPLRRIGHLLRAGAWSDAEVALVEFADSIAAGGAIDALLRLIEQFPARVRDSSPRLAYLRGLGSWARWDWASMHADMRRARVGHAQAGDADAAQRALVREAIALGGLGRADESAALLAELPSLGLPTDTLALACLLAAWHALDAGDVQAVAARYEAVLDVIEGSDSVLLWSQCVPRPLYASLPGMRPALQRFVDGALLRSADAPSPLRVAAHVTAAWLAVWSGRLAAALDAAAQADDDIRWLGRPPRLALYLHPLLALVHALQGRPDEAGRATDAMLAHFDAHPAQAAEGHRSMVGHYLHHALRVADVLGDADAVLRLAQRIPSDGVQYPELLRVQLAALPARVAQARGRIDEAAAGWARALADEMAMDVMGQAREARLRLAHALLALGRRTEAAAALEPVFDAVDASGEIGGALLAGPRILGELAGAPWHGALDADAVALLGAWARCLQPADAASAPVPTRADRCAPAPHGLSAREFEVLQRIAAGDSNKLIARAFGLSPHTVKRHVANLLDKLGVDSRGQAAAWLHARH